MFAADSPGGKLAFLLREGNAEAVIAAGLHEFLMEVQDLCADIGSVIFDKYLRFE